MEIGEHVRIWPHGSEMSFAGRICGFEHIQDTQGDRTMVVVDCVDGVRRRIDSDNIKRRKHFGKLLDSDGEDIVG